MTDAQTLVEGFRAAMATPGVHAARWASRATRGMENLGVRDDGHARGVVRMVRCPDGSRFCFRFDAFRRAWALPGEAA
jgi:hypothetical protein